MIYLVGCFFTVQKCYLNLAAISHLILPAALGVCIINSLSLNKAIVAKMEKLTYLGHTAVKYYSPTIDLLEQFKEHC